ncbi:MAG: hypothetical protein LUH22_16435 [Bacteroides sp.]|nr:hypothetical protein [Bacteroides sp.]
MAKLNEVAKVSVMNNTESLLGINTTGAIIQITKENAYPLATSSSNGLLSNHSYNLIKRKNAGTDTNENGMIFKCLRCTNNAQNVSIVSIGHLASAPSVYLISAGVHSTTSVANVNLKL